MAVASPGTVAPSSASADSGTLSSLGTRQALAGFFLSGVMLSFLGAILPSWQNLSSQYLTVGLYFLGLIAGLLSAVGAAHWFLQKRGLSWTLSFACAIAGTGFLYLAMASPPWDPWWRVGGMAVIGFAAGVLHTAIFEAISPMYRHDPAATVNVGGMFFGLGCLTVALLVSGIYYIYTPAAIQVWIAVIPALAGWGYWTTRFAPVPVTDSPAPHQILAELKSPAAVLLSLILFFQLGNEWAIAGWLPIFLSHRLGISPETSLMMLALYWLALLIGRAASQWILPRVRHSRVLIASVVAAIFGCVILLATNNRFGALTGILLVGCAFAPIYPLLVEKIGHRFPGYHPGHYNGIFSIAMACGLLAPAALGFFASVWGVGVVMDLPLIGSIIVFVLLVLIWVEARFLEASTKAPVKVG